MKKFLAPLIAALAVASFAGADARASTLWTYDWTATGTSVPSDNGHYSLAVTPYMGSAGPGTSDIIAANLQFNSIGGYTGADTFSHGNLILTGTINGTQTVSFDIGFQTTITGPNQIVSTTPTVTTLSSGTGGYDVTVKSVTLPGALNGGTGGTGVGSILVSVVPPGANGNPNGTPEPSTMLLSCVGLAFGGFATWRKRKQALAA
jgi:hypothetical protein